MPSRTNLDMDVLRTFVAGFELGSFARAAERVGRSQSAVSTQLRRLEEQVGQPLVARAGRGLALTAAGETLFSYARRILELNDEAVERVHGDAVEGSVRLGLPQDFAETWLPRVLARFGRAHPNVHAEVRAERNAEIVARTRKGELDVALAWGDPVRGLHSERLGALQAEWIAHPEWNGVPAAGKDPLPLIAFEPPCIFRSAAIRALDAAGMPWRIAFTTSSLAGLWAAAEAGLGVTVRTAFGLPPTIAARPPADLGLPPLPSIPLALHRAETDPGPAASRLSAMLREAIADQLST
ncbi:MAG TPA: LysR substrate-binding domain-containing protein [Anaeromyxobacteraceae bacterium]|nr:LysR substrate-binding domain-containing protein [Anaeromyxobacteraceae bacterium]